MKSFSNETLSFFFRKFCFSYNLDLVKFVSSANLIAEIRYNERALRSGEPCTCEYVTVLQSFHRGTLNIHWCIAQNVQPTFSMSALFRRSFKTYKLLSCIQEKENFLQKKFSVSLEEDSYFVFIQKHFYILLSHIFFLQICFLFPSFEYIISNQRDGFF